MAFSLIASHLTSANIVFTNDKYMNNNQVLYKRAIMVCCINNLWLHSTSSPIHGVQTQFINQLFSSEDVRISGIWPIQGFVITEKLNQRGVVLCCHQKQFPTSLYRAYTFIHSQFFMFKYGACRII